MDTSKIAVLMGSDSDLPVVSKCLKILKEYDIPFEAHVMSAHRSPEQVAMFAASAYDNGFRAIICAAGKAAHLAGAVAAQTSLPVIGLPIKASTLDGLDALLSTVQMPKGVPVATVAIDGAENAAYLAIQILATSSPELYNKLRDVRKVMSSALLEVDAQLAKKIEEI